MEERHNQEGPPQTGRDRRSRLLPLTPLWIYNGSTMELKEDTMPVNLSIKNVPEELAERLRERAKRHHRSLQGELLAILEEAVLTPKRLTLEEAYQQVRRLRLKTEPEADRMIREDRDAR